MAPDTSDDSATAGLPEPSAVVPSMPMQAITTERLVLEPLTAAHADAMFDALADSTLYRYLDQPAPPSAEHLRRTYFRLESRLSPDGRQRWLNWVIRVPGEVPIGYVQATVVVAKRTAWIAYILSRQHQGRGYAREATSGMLAHLASVYRTERYLATVEADNRPSVRLLEALAFCAATASERQGHSLTPTERLFVRAPGHAQNAT